jgi:hypothetical protein
MAETEVTVVTEGIAAVATVAEATAADTVAVVIDLGMLHQGQLRIQLLVGYYFGVGRAVPMNRKLLVVLLAMIASHQEAHTQEIANRICVVQVKEGFEGTDQTQATGIDATKLVQELSTRKLKDNTTITAIPLIRMPRKNVDAKVEQLRCGYVVEVWRHISVDDLDSGSPGPALVQPMGDRDMVEYQLRRPGVRKVLASGSALPPTYHGKSHWLTTPYPIFATAIVKRIDR